MPDWTVLSREPDMASLFERLCRALADEGVPLKRGWLGTITLHPQLYAVGWAWTGGAAERRTIPHGFENTENWRTSPARLVRESGVPLRRRLGAGEPADLPVLQELLAQGITDYYARPVAFGPRIGAVVTWSSDAPGGFSDDDAARLDALHPMLDALTWRHAEHEIAEALLRTYLGADAGDRVMSGRVRRGDGETIEAAIAFFDLRDFTALSDRLPREALLRLLDAWFDAAVAGVEGAGGQVLKFLGDGLLAVFPGDPALAGASRARDACARALAAARDVRARVDAANEGRETPIRYGVALHFGDVLYGNIGGRNRLDFTVIGPAVNTAARIEPLCARLGKAPLLTAAFAERCGAAVVSVGRHALKGVAEPVEVFEVAPTDGRSS